MAIYWGLHKSMPCKYRLACYHWTYLTSNFIQVDETAVFLDQLSVSVSQRKCYLKFFSLSQQHFSKQMKDMAAVMETV